MAILGWAAAGLFVRFWQLGLEMQPFFARRTLWGYPVFATVTGAFGAYLEGVETRQHELLEERRQALLLKRKRAAEREAAEGGSGVTGAVA